MMNIEMFKEVALRRDLPEHHLRCGDVGTVVEILPHPTGGPRGVILEVFNAVGDTIAIVTLPETDIQPLTADGIFNVRPLSQAG
jgi:hypothetical protein